jgi:beta-lactamase superfamily II metal-dependent hydrolase
MRKGVLVLALALVAAVASWSDRRVSAADARAEGALRIAFIDVMGGAATLIVTPENETVLIDSGWPGFDDRDPKRIAKALRDVAGRTEIDHLITTHWHTDHVGGAAGLAKIVPIGRFWDRGLPEDKLPGVDFPDLKADDPLVAAYREVSKGKRAVLRPGDTLPLKGKEVQIVVLAAGTKIIEPGLAATNAKRCASAPANLPIDNSDNARSLVLRLRFGAFDFLDAGDLTWNIERSLVCPLDLVGPIDLYQVTHHGLDISNHPTLLETCAPTVAVMNNGPKKGGSAETVHRLRNLPSLKALYALHKNVNTGPGDNADPALTANSDPAGGRYIVATIPAGGESYSVKIEGGGEPRAFESR